jgi:hypothetical protein
VHPALWCAIAVALCALASQPKLEMGFNDDFSYIWTAKVLADTGHVVYNGWATAMLGWQLYLGALFIKAFGFSFTVVRASILVVGMATAALLQRLFARMGLNEWNATLATLSIALSPLFLPLTFSFMTDVPGFFAILICIYGCVRAVEAKSDRAAAGWLIFAALTNAVGGTVRQIAWLGVLVMVPSTAWVVRRRRGVLLAAAAALAIAVAFIAWCSHWFQTQPYAVSEGLLLGNRLLSHKPLACLFFSLPIMIAFVAHYPVRERWARIQGAAALAPLFLTVLFFAFWQKGFRTAATYLIAPFSDEWVTPKGLDIHVLLGDRPDVLSMSLRIALTLLIFVALIAFLICFLNRSRLIELRGASADGRLSNWNLFAILGPFCACYFVLLETRSKMMERYFLPLIFVFLLLLIRFYQSRIAPRLPVMTGAVVVVFAVFAVATMHDLMATERARLEAADELRAAGIPRSEIKAGVDYDGWTQIDMVGYLNDPRLKMPRGAYHPQPPTLLPTECAFWFDSYTPAIQARYRLSYTPIPCFSESEFPPFEFDTWLSPRHQKIYILRLPANSTSNVQEAGN